MGIRTAMGAGDVVRGVLRGLLVLPLLLLLPGLLEASLSSPTLETSNHRNNRIQSSYQNIKSHLQAPSQGYDDFPGLSLSGWKITALSHMATGLMSMGIDAAESGEEEQRSEIGVLLDEVAARAVSNDISPYDVPLEQVEDFNDWGFYLGHLSLTLGCARYMSGSTRHDELHGRIVRYQMTRMSDDGDHHSRSYPNSYKWPADQALTLAAAALYDRIHGTTLSVEPIARWLRAVAELSADGLHPLTLSVPTAMPIDVSGTLLPPMPSAETPRGSALSPTVFYMAQFAPEEAASLYERYRAERLDTVLGFGGFREWPGPGGSDIEGGPVVLGLGSIATATGLAPARIFQDNKAYTTIIRSSLVAGVPSDIGAGRGHLLVPLLGEAILFNGITARAWFSSPAPLALSSDEAPVAVGAWLLMLIDLALLITLLAKPSRRLLRRLQERARSARPEPSSPATDPSAA